jgi:phosphoribosyl 1,2-cyclic phosphodiesterase
LLAESNRTGVPATGSILIGHTHWDHIQGLPFFAPLFQPGGRWAVYGPRGLGSSLAQTLGGQMEYQYFPVSLEQFGAEVAFHDLVEGRFEIGEVVVRTRYLNHPALTLGYRIEADGVAIAYLADHEPHDPDLAAGGVPAPGTEDGRHVEFLAGADLVIHDSQYLAAEYAEKRGWGHSTVEHVVDAAVAGGVRRVVLFHHDPTRTDDALDSVLALARARSAAAAGPEVFAGAEGDELVVEPRLDSPATAEGAPVGVLASTAPALEDLDVTVVVAVADPDLAGAVASVASAEQLKVRVVDPDSLRAGRGAGHLVDDGGRAIVVTDLVETADGGVGDSLGVLATDPSSRVAVLAVSSRLPAIAGATAAVTDWVVWPATLTHLRTKLRATVLRRACRWLAAPVPGDEERRLRSLRNLGLLDTAPEDRFDRLTERARQLLGMPIALVTLVDGDRQWFKSRQGGDGATESPRDQSVCAHAILGSDVLQVPDLLQDDRFADNPAVIGNHARFYAGAPLVLSDGSRIGTLCVVDRRPRLLDQTQLDQLRTLAREVEAELERSA